MQHDHELLLLRGVTKTYGADTPVLDRLDLAVGRGELLAIVGPSGSGKSTLLHVMGTLDRPTSGAVRIAGHDVTTMRDRELAGLRAREIGFVFQQFHLLPAMSATDNVAQGLLYVGVTRRERRRRAAAALVDVGLGHRTDHRATDLSGGERQRVAIARALLAQPSIVFADEPTGNLDTRSGERIVTLLRDLHERGTTVVVITHDRELADAMPRQVEIRDGRIVGDHRR
jgi:putative ABC transport system ATP-binding protein